MEANEPIIRQRPTDVTQVCSTDQYATLTFQGVECRGTADTWTNECDNPSDCCDSGELLKITPSGLECFPFLDKTSTYTTPICHTCCGAGEFAVIPQATPQAALRVIPLTPPIPFTRLTNLLTPLILRIRPTRPIDLRRIRVIRVIAEEVDAPCPFVLIRMRSIRRN